MNIRWIFLISLLALVLGSCGISSQVAVGQSPNLSPMEPQQGGASKMPSPDLPEKTIQLTSTLEATDMTANPPDEDKLVNLAKQDLAARLKIGLDQIVLIKTTEIKSPDISAGCKLGAGQIITQGDQIYGYRIWLEAVGEEYIYHVSVTEKIILCPKFRPGSNNPLLNPKGSTEVPQNPSP